MSLEKSTAAAETSSQTKKPKLPEVTTNIPKQEIEGQESNLELIKEKKPYITKLFQKSELLQYLTSADDPSIASNFINTYFYGLLAKESSFGTDVYHLKTASRQVLTKAEYKSEKTLPGTKIPMETYEQWRVERNKTGKWPKEIIKTQYKLSFGTFIKSVNKISTYVVKSTSISPKQFKRFLKQNPITGEFLTPLSELKKSGIKSYQKLKEIVDANYISKSPFQLIGNTLTDIKEALAAKKPPASIKAIWSSKATPSRADLKSFDTSAKLSVLNLERIYQYCKTELKTPYLKARKKELVIPIILMCYLAGMGTAKKLFKLANKKQFKGPNALKSLLDTAKTQKIITQDHIQYISRIRGYAHKLTPTDAQTPQTQKPTSTAAQKAKEAKESQRSQTKTKLTKLKQKIQAELEVKTEVRNKQEFPASMSIEQIRKDLFNMQFQPSNTELVLPERPYYDPDYKPDPENPIFSDEFGADPEAIKTNADMFFDDQYEDIDSMPRQLLVKRIIDEYEPKFTAKIINNSTIETYTFPYGIQLKITEYPKSKTINKTVSYSKNIKKVYAQTHINYYKDWPND